jgi:SAM-dependent methyltransferase
MKEYGKQHNLIYHKMQDYLRSYYRDIFDYFKIPKVQDKNALDVGCGHGYVLELLKNLGYKPYALDISEDSLERAKNLVPETKVILHDAQLPFPFSEKFDLISCFGLLSLLEKPETVIENCYQTLNEDGIFIASVPNKFGFISLFFGERIAWAVRERSIRTLIVPVRININRKSPMEWKRILTKLKWEKLMVLPLQRIPFSKKLIGKNIFLKIPLGDPIIIFGRK